jgi:hypothetical protein
LTINHLLYAMMALSLAWYVGVPLVITARHARFLMQQSRIRKRKRKQRDQESARRHATRL